MELVNGKAYVDGKEIGYEEGDAIVITDEDIIEETMADINATE